MVKKIVFAFSAVAMLLGLISVVQSRTLGAEPFTYRVIMLNDRLWNISREVMPEAGGVSRNQIMFAILRKNPDAFRGGNINYLKTGVELTMPTLAEVQAEVPEQVNALVKMHKSTWRDGQVAAPNLYELPGTVATASSRSASPAPKSEATARAFSAAPELGAQPTKAPTVSAMTDLIQGAPPAKSEVISTGQVVPTFRAEPAAPPAASASASPESVSSTSAVSTSPAGSAPSGSLGGPGDVDGKSSGAMSATLGWLAMSAVLIFALYAFARSRTPTPLEPKHEVVPRQLPRRPVPAINLENVLPSIQPVDEIVVRQGAIGFGQPVADAREVEIKLRIAKAYVDVGRTHAAKEILVEVGRNGRPEPRQATGKQSRLRVA